MDWLLVPRAPAFIQPAVSRADGTEGLNEGLPFSSYSGQETSPTEVSGKAGDSQHSLPLWGLIRGICARTSLPELGSEPDTEDAQLFLNILCMCVCVFLCVCMHMYVCVCALITQVNLLECKRISRNKQYILYRNTHAYLVIKSEVFPS